VDWIRGEWVSVRDDASVVKFSIVVQYIVPFPHNKLPS
jgi:hypothetical protein